MSESPTPLPLPSQTAQPVLDEDRKTTGWVRHVTCALAVLLYFLVWWKGYSYLNERGSDPARMILWTRPADVTPGIIQPWTAVVYVLVGSLLPLLPFWYYWNLRGVRFVLTAYCTASAIAFVCYWLWPVGIVRSTDRGDGIGPSLMRHVISVDRAANCTPSSHVIYSVLAALLVGRANPRGIPMVVGVAAAVSLSTITTGQHYWIDVITGASVALFAYAFARSTSPPVVRAATDDHLTTMQGDARH